MLTETGLEYWANEQQEREPDDLDLVPTKVTEDPHGERTGPR